MRIFLALVVVAFACPGCAERSQDTASSSPAPITHATVAPKPSVMKRVNVPHFTPLPHKPAGAAAVGADTGVAETNP